MTELPPSVGEFASDFVRFMRAMHEVAEQPESPLASRLREHLGAEPAELPVTSATFSIADRPNLQLALDATLPERSAHGYASHMVHSREAGFSQLLMRQGRGGWERPVEYVDVQLGDGRVVRCISSAVLLARFEDSPVALVVSGEPSMHHGHPEVHVEGISPDDGVVSRLLVALRQAMRQHNVFRGRVISLGRSGAVTFPSIPSVEREAVILPPGTLDRLERHAVGIAERAERLIAARRHLKRGVLLHGPPGTGKTLTVNYLLSSMRGRTTVILTGQSLGMVEQAFAIARELTPATVVLEDVDLVAEERSMPGDHGPLFELLNQLEGLAEDADLLVLLTTNRPDRIEPALAARPGRVDLALELPLPDADGRRELMRLYARELELDEPTLEQLVSGSEGVTGAFIKELMRQATLRAALQEREPLAADALAVLQELLDDRATLTRRLLGQPAGDGGRRVAPSPSMFRALTASGMPVPEDLHPGGSTDEIRALARSIVHPTERTPPCAS